jgi:hypothetical protein
LLIANEYLGHLVSNEDGFSIAGYERRQIRLRVDVVKASAQWNRFDNDTPLHKMAEAAM